MGEYELWLLNDRGEQLTLLNPALFPNLGFFSYSRSALGLGTVQIGMPHNEYKQLMPLPFTPDLLVDVWRSPGPGYPKRRENIYFLRKQNIYTREDGVEIMELWGRDAKDLLNRRYVVQAAESSYTRKTDEIDDMMKSIVREQMEYGNALDADGVVDYDRAWPAGEFTVEAEHSLGPILTDMTLSDNNVLDMLKELRSISFQKNAEDPSNKKIYFDVVWGQNLNWGEIYILDEADVFDPMLDETGDEILDEQSGTSGERTLMLQFQTFADLRGKDRTNGPIFSVPNGNLISPSHTVNHLEERNTMIVRGQGRGENRITATVQDSQAATASRWNRVESLASASSETGEDILEEVGRGELWNNRTEELLDATFADSPGSPDTPRSLYGVDWDLGDRLPIHYAGRAYEAEVMVVYAGVNDKGQENVVGRSAIDE